MGPADADNVLRFPSAAKVQDRAAAEAVRAADALKGPAGGGTSGGMPPELIERVERLESDMKDVKGILGRIEPMIARIDEKLSAAATTAGMHAELRKVEAGVAAVGSRAAGIEGAVSRMPSTFQMVSWFVGVAFGIATLVFTVARITGTR